ncbi:MAG TPA: hypothetical protein VIS56_02490, partial [Candidatus Saccharimonadales bacterium]
MTTRHLRSLCTSIALSIGLLLPLAIPSTALAAGEQYNWIDHYAIQVSGGDLKPNQPTTLSYRSGSGLAGVERFSGVITHKTGCKILLELRVSTRITDAAGLTDVPSGSGDCDNTIASAYIGTVVQIGGSRSASSVKATITVWSPYSFSLSPATIILSVKGTPGLPEIPANKQADPAATALAPEKQPAFYQATFFLKGNTEYTICSNTPSVLNCSNTTTGDYSSNACQTRQPTCYNFKTPAVPAINAYDFNAKPELVDTTSVCDESSAPDHGWLVCGAIVLASEAAEKFDDLVLNLLKIDTNAIFNDAEQSGVAFHKAWGLFRNLAYAILIIIGLLMILSQIIGVDLFDAYTIRKMLPKLAISVILVALSWPGLEFLFNASNDAASAAMELISGPFKDLDAGTAVGGGDITLAAIIRLLVAGGAIIGGASYLAILGVGGIAALIGSILLAVLSAFVLLAARNVVAYLLIIMAPIAIVCFAFEPFKKLFSFWRTLLVTILLSLPAVGIIIELSHVGALVAFISNTSFGTVTAIAILIGGYVLIWTVFKKLDAVAGQLGNIVSSVTGRLQKGLADYRNETAKRRWNEGVMGQRSLGTVGNTLTNIARRARVSSHAGGGFFGAKYRAGAQKMLQKATDEMVKDDNGRSGGDDEVMLMAQAGLGSRDIIRALRSRGVSASQARERVLGAETNLGATMGTSAMRVAAHKALLASNTSYRAADFGGSQDAADRQLYADAGRLVSDGLISATDATAIIKSNKARVDRSGAGFSTILRQVVRSADRVQQGVQPAITDTEIVNLRKEALFGSGPGAIIAGRHEALTALAPQMLDQLNDSLQPGPSGVIDEIGISRELAALAGRYDVMSQVSPQNASIMANEVMSQTLIAAAGMPRFRDANNNAMTVQQMIESYRNNPEFLHMRREYAAQAATQAQAFQAAQAAAGGGPVIPGA